VRSLAILGPQGAGKSSIAELFQEHRGYQRHGIADAIKHLASLAYLQLEKDEVLALERYSGLTQVTGRELLQDIGAALREVDRKFWLRVWRQDYFEIQRMGYGVVVDDVRLPEEVDYLRAVDPTIFVVRLTADLDTRRLRMGGELLGTHDITEMGWTAAEFDLTVETSDISPEEAYRQITDAMEEVV
jgi:chloramphenicol 3-O-phosphotransferase